MTPSPSCLGYMAMLRARIAAGTLNEYELMVDYVLATQDRHERSRPTPGAVTP